MNRNTIAVGVLGIVLANCFSANAQEKLGSGMSLEDLQGGAKRRKALVDAARVKTIVVSAAKAPVPLLKYRLWPSATELKPGSAYVNLTRAIGRYQSVPDDIMRDLRESMAANEDREKKDVDLTDRLVRFESVFLELEIMSLKEDFIADHQIRDLRGKALITFQLSEVQQARKILQLIRWRGSQRVGQGDFRGAIETWKSGLRMARLVGSGELMVQQVVVATMEQTLQDGILDAIQQPDCPNLYWALASVPHSPEPLQRSIQFELANLERFFPIFDDTKQWINDRQYWQTRWQESFNLLKDFHIANQQLTLATLLGLQCAAINDEARKELIEDGLDPKQVMSMCPEQIVAIRTQKEMREVCDLLQTDALLPPYNQFAKADNGRSRLTELVSTRGELLSTLIILNLIPRTEQASIQVNMVIADFFRLMTIEALRMYAAQYNGELPNSLEDLRPVPALCDPFTNRLIQYEKTLEDGVATATLELALPKYWDQNRKLKVQIRK